MGLRGHIQWDDATAFSVRMNPVQHGRREGPGDKSVRKTPTSALPISAGCPSPCNRTNRRYHDR